jgi:DNA sulfur modification protein DndD
VKLRRVEVKNFKLMHDVAIDFSVDPKQPLTLIRAENGSGKTSLLYALLWGFYGREALRSQDADTTRGRGSVEMRRLSATDWPPDEPCDIAVRIDFEATDTQSYAGEDVPVVTQYRLTRSVTEIPRAGDKVDSQREQLTVHAYTDAGSDKLEDAAARALIRRLAPEQMKHIFFTDGDSVQRFITGELGTAARQGAVREAIKALLGLDMLRTAESDLAKARTTLRRRMAAAGGGALSRTLEQLEAAAEEKDRLEAESTRITERINNVTAAIERRDQRLFDLQVHGDIENIRRRRKTAKQTLAGAEDQLGAQKRAQRDLLKGEALSWALMGDTLRRGMEALESLADRNIIPGTSVEVLRDRLAIGTCICGTDLADGSEHRAHIEQLLADQERVDPNRERLTALLHEARPRALEFAEDDGAARWLERLNETEALRAGVERTIRDQNDALKECEEALRRLEEAEVDRLLEAQTRDRQQQKQYAVEQREIEIKLAEVADQVDNLTKEVDRARTQERTEQELLDNLNVAEDLHKLVTATLETLETDYLAKASNRMNELFIEIAGSSPELTTAVFTAVRLTPDYAIEVQSGGFGRTLDPDFEINGANKRALTLSFIWALMEIAGVSAPRTIDTPLGMMAGGVKRRFVDLLTKPADNDFQIILLVTRSEIATVEDLFDERAGIIRTLSCSKDYPVDLVSDWGDTRPTVRVCDCTHRESCDVCARRDDATYSLLHRSLEMTR